MSALCDGCRGTGWPGPRGEGSPCSKCGGSGLVEDPPKRVETFQPGDKLDFKPHVSGRCPCGMDFVVGDVVKPDGSMIPCVIHVEPFCDKFVNLDVDAFVAYATGGES